MYQEIEAGVQNASWGRVGGTAAGVATRKPIPAGRYCPAVCTSRALYWLANVLLSPVQAGEVTLKRDFRADAQGLVASTFCLLLREAQQVQKSLAFEGLGSVAFVFVGESIGEGDGFWVAARCKQCRMWFLA